MSMSRCPALSFPIHPSSVHDDDDSSSSCGTPPFTSSASIPFNWEKEPGRPIPFPCTTLVPYSEPICMKKLNPPPRMASVESKLTTFLDGSSLGPMERMMSDREQQKCKKKVWKWMFRSWSLGGNRSCKMGVREGYGGSFVYPSSVSAGFDDGRDCCSEFGGESESVFEQAKMKRTRSFFKFTQVLPWKLNKDGASVWGHSRFS